MRPSNLANTGLPIPPHPDNPYRDPVPTVQLLHCLASDVAGGESGVTDGFAAAAALRAQDPAAFGLLAATPVTFGYADDTAELRQLDAGPAREGPAMTDPVSMITGLFASEGAADYLGEPVTQAAHMLQAAALAERDGAPAALIAAALLHDVGHFTGTVTGHDLMRGTDNRHSEQGASWLARWFGPEVTEPVRLHVDAKRYLCATEPGYLARLSPASVYTLGVQGGPMTGAELAAFEARPHAADACRVRRWDDAAKDPGAGYPPLGHFVPLLRGLVTD